MGGAELLNELLGVGTFRIVSARALNVPGTGPPLSEEDNVRKGLGPLMVTMPQLLKYWSKVFNTSKLPCSSSQ